jgi:hypothetical protein
MSQPQFLADNDLDDAIFQGVLRREPSVDFVRLRDLGQPTAKDAEVLAIAASSGRILISHDVNTMIAAATARLNRGDAMNGLLVAHQWQDVAAVIEDLLLIWAASEAEEWQGRIVFLPL